MIVHISKPHVISDWLHQHRQRRIIRIALDRAYAAFDRRYPQWTASLFDKHFITQTVVLWLTTPQTMDKELAPSNLAAAWAAQLSTQPRQQQVLMAQCLPVAAEFLWLLRKELSTVPAMLSIFMQNHTGSETTEDPGIPALSEGGHHV